LIQRSVTALACLCLTSPLLAAEGRYSFVDIHREAGIDVTLWQGRADKPHLLESTGSGAALFDYDLDGDLDLYLVNGWRLEGERVLERGGNRLFRNRGNGTFDDMTKAAGVAGDGWGTAVTVGDIDGDGDPDLFVANFGPDLLYRNRGDGSFAPEQPSPGIDGWSSSAVFFDADGDQDLDFFVCGYVAASLAQVLAARPALAWKERMVMAGPFGFEGLANRFFRNDGGGHFTEATAAAGLDDVGLFYSLGVIAADLDGDGANDLYVANDSNPNYLYQNAGGGRFKEVGLWSGSAFDANGNAQASMGIATGDYDGDGRTDLFVTNFEEDFSTLYRNLGNLAFEDVSARTGVGPATYRWLSWGTVFADFDLDGDLELFVANGHIYPQADAAPRSGTGYAQPNQLLELQNGRFVDVSADAGPGLAVAQSSRGVAAGDIDGDGDLDLVIVNMDAPPTLLRNDSERRGHWLLIDAPGAQRVEIAAGARHWYRDRVDGGSYASHSDPRFHFGLGANELLDTVHVRWPGGRELHLTKVAADQVLQLRPPAPIGD
jgi:hypothetical protein